MGGGEGCGLGRALAAGQDGGAKIIGQRDAVGDMRAGGHLRSRPVESQLVMIANDQAIDRLRQDSGGVAVAVEPDEIRVCAVGTGIARHQFLARIAVLRLCADAGGVGCDPPQIEGRGRVGRNRPASQRGIAVRAKLRADGRPARCGVEIAVGQYVDRLRAGAGRMADRNRYGRTQRGAEGEGMAKTHDGDPENHYWKRCLVNKRDGRKRNYAKNVSIFIMVG